MKFLQKPAVALLLAVVLIPGSLLLNTKAKLGEACEELAGCFYENSEEYGKSPLYYLNSRIGDAASLATVGSHYPELTAVTESLRKARTDLVSACEQEELHAMYLANRALTDAVTAFEQAAADVALDPLDQDNYPDFLNELKGAQRQLDNGGYNRAVLAFQDTVLERFPASVLAPLVGADAPPLFE